MHSADDSLSGAPLASALRHRLLSREQERQLALRVLDGDDAAREALVWTRAGVT
jgi:hypothetical protein